MGVFCEIVSFFLLKSFGITKKALLLQRNSETGCEANAKIAQLVEHNLAKVGVAGSSPVFRSKI